MAKVVRPDAPCAKCLEGVRVNGSYCQSCANAMNRATVAKYASEPCFQCGQKIRSAGSIYCLDCNNAQKLTNKLRRYGSSVEDYYYLVDLQEGLCAIENCGRQLAHIDHDADTGEFRGLLCNNCNLALGLLDEDPDRAVGLAEYARQCQNVKVTYA